MKRITIFLAFILATAFAVTSCSKGPKDNLARKWKVSVEDMKKEMAAEMDKQIASMPDSMKAEAKARMEESMKMVEENAAKVTMEFKSDGTYENVEGSETKKGKWKISDDGKKITTTEDGEGKSEQSVDVVELSASKLVIKAGERTITFIAA